MAKSLLCLIQDYDQRQQALIAHQQKRIEELENENRRLIFQLMNHENTLDRMRAGLVIPNGAIITPVDNSDRPTKIEIVKPGERK